MMKKIACFTLGIVLCLVALPYCCSESGWPADSGLVWLGKLYNYGWSDSDIDEMQASFHRQTFDCGSVQVALNEVLYDGAWLYTSAVVTPTDPETTLIMPGGTGLDCLVAGGYQENLRDDSRTFQAAAIEDQKELILVHINPVEFDDQPEPYFTDHRQDAGDQSTMFSGAPVGWMGEEVTIHLSIRISLVDPLTGESTHIDTYEFPVEVHRVGSMSNLVVETIEE